MLNGGRSLDRWRSRDGLSKEQTLRTRGWEKAGQAENPRKTVSGREQSNSTGKGKEELAELVELVKSGKAACWWTHSWGSRAWMGFGQREQKGTT